MGLCPEGALEHFNCIQRAPSKILIVSRGVLLNIIITSRGGLQHVYDVQRGANWFNCVQRDTSRGALGHFNDVQRVS